MKEQLAKIKEEALASFQAAATAADLRSEEHTSELQSQR